MMKENNFKNLERRVSVLKKRCPWFASLLLHCLETRNPKAITTMRNLLSRLRINAA